MIKKLIINFLIGGILFSLIYYIANIIEDPALSALIALLPLSILCCYIIEKPKVLIKHLENLIPVSIITLLVTIILIIIFKNELFNKFTAITLGLFLWMALQLLKYYYY